MEKLPIVYDNSTGTLYLVKNEGRQTLLMAPSRLLSTLEVEDTNCTELEYIHPYDNDTLFKYLCMTGETVNAEDLIQPILKMGEIQEESEMKRVTRQLKHWGVVSDMEPVRLDLDVRTQLIRDGSESVEILGDGVCMVGNATAECAAETLATALLYAADTDFFPSIVVSITAFLEKDKALSEEVFKMVREQVQHEAVIKIVKGL